MTAGNESELWVVMPVFDEEASVARVFAEWLPALCGLGVPFRVVVVDDGSRDRTPELLAALAAANPEVQVRRQPNAGHGRACLEGYRRALERGAGWILQLDSDGQCDPAHLPALWRAREEHAAVFGYRARRDDGLARWAISRVLSVVAWLAYGTWVRDANVPYRLVRRDALAAAVAEVSDDFELVNVLVALRLARTTGIHWVPIRFRERHGGRGSLRPASFARHGLRLFRQLRRERTTPGRDGGRGPGRPRQNQAGRPT